MSNYNKVILLGRLTRDPELRYTAGGTAVAKIGFAVNNRYKQGDTINRIKTRVKGTG